MNSHDITIAKIRYMLEMIKREVNNALNELDNLANEEILTEKPSSIVSELPELLTAELVMRHYTLRSTNDLYLGVKSGKYPKPISNEKKNKRLWLREDWDNWIKQAKQK